MAVITQRYHFEYTLYVTPCGSKPNVYAQGDLSVDFYIDPDKFQPETQIKLEQNQIAYVKRDIAESNYLRASKALNISIEDAKKQMQFFVRIENIFPCEIITK